MAVLVVLGVYNMSKWRWRSSNGHTGGLRAGVDGPRNRLEVSLVVLVVILTYTRYEWTGNVCIPRRVV